MRKVIVNFLCYLCSTTSTLSVGSTGSQARLIQSSHAPSNYQPVLMKDLGKQKSPVKDLDVVQMFDDAAADTVMEGHLKDLQGVTTCSSDPTRNIAQYMENLKEKHLEYVELDFSKKPLPPPVPSLKELTRDGSSDAAASTTETSQTSDESPAEDSKQPIVDRKVDKVFSSGERRKSGSLTPKEDGSQTPKKILKSPRQSIELSRSPDRSKSQGNSPVKIYRVKTPKDSLDVERLTVVRQGSRDKSPDSKGSSRRSSETGILKRSLSPKTDKENVPISILKRSASPNNKSHSPDRPIRKSLSPCNSFDMRSPKSGLSPRGSVCSPDRYGRLYVQNSLSPHSSFDRSPDRCYDHAWGTRGFDRSPERGRRSLSASARSSFESNRSSEHYYRQHSPYQSFEYSPDRESRRASKSLERSPKGSFEQNPYAAIYADRLPYVRQERSYSDETILASRPCAPDCASLSSETLRPTCVECLYARKPS